MFLPVKREKTAKISYHETRAETINSFWVIHTMKYSDFFHTKSRESFCFLKNSQELIILPLAKKSKKKFDFFSPRIFRSLVHATNKKGIIENIVHAFYPLNKKYTFFWSKSMCSFWGSSRGIIFPI